ncbi:PREDICTED: dentin matrix acidic phosphoprotein 1-like [Tarenaya hassleriana]|uniref:dentin matrix acidic phosphoprotein 1-like n=1 Tax=Tarenaya hassleriana TaxID=28532 RepID=UPI00053CA134|nr:PREDICTED: dentin matrix acidic phosphoprotein 1-like [Tarenaya hassleriana]XP_010524448.1 PREDICTED: dentin matrix acidic phosphoprotein 1-like [Tarenaya hassleriana]
MAKPENNENFPEKQTWGTWEELLLACAVHRFGTDSWDSVAVELRKRTPSLRSVTAASCRLKYLDLKRRFSRKPSAAEDDTATEIPAVPWLDELRKLRVAELRREVERYDLSISSLQLKVKRLEEERERSIKEDETETENSDLDKIAEKKESYRDSDENSGKPAVGPANQSVNESNSPDPKGDEPGTGSEDDNREEKVTKPDTGEPNRSAGDGKPAGEDSCRGSCESGAKESAGNSGRIDPGREAGDSGELIESVAESKGGASRGEEEAKETSDVQSSASLPRKDEADNEEDQSPTVKGIPFESQPLADFLEILQSQSSGSHFSRRLQSQETPEYGKIIRQHVDFEMIRTRLEEGWYAVSTGKFFRDLLLLINNVRVFYGKGSSEFKASEQLNELVREQMALKVQKPTSQPKEESSMVPKAVPESSHPLSLKPRMSVPMIACRKRSSLAARSSAPVQKKLKMTPVVDEKPATDMEDEEKTSDKDEEPLISKKRMTRERTSSNTKRAANKNVKNRSKIDTTSNVGLPTKGRSPNDSSEPKKSDQEKKGNTSASSKKQSVATFLKRMKGGSSSDTTPETGKTNSGADSSNLKRGAEQRKNNSNKDKADAGKTQTSQKRTSGKKQTNEKGSPAKKSSGRAPKRAAAASSSPSPAKRGKEVAEKEAGPSTRAKKRTRR